MIFAEQHPNAKPGDRIEVEGDELIRTERAEFCWDCGRGCQWISTSFYAYFCSEQCLKNKWKEYWEAMRK